MKKLLKIALVLVILLIVVLGVIVYKIDSIAKAAIEQGGTYALGVDTTVASVDIGVLSGSFAMSGLTVGNPDGYPAEHLMKSGDFKFAIQSESLSEDTVVIDEIVIDGLDVHIEKKDGKYNVQAITDYMQQKFGGSDETTEPDTTEDTGPGKKVMVKKVVVKNITASAPNPLTGSAVKVSPPDITLENVSQDNLPIQEVIAQLFPAIMAGVITGLGDDFTGLAGDLTGDLTSVADALGGNATELLNSSVANVSQELTKVTEQLGDVTEQLEGATEGVTEALEGITGGEDGDNPVGNILNNLGSDKETDAPADEKKKSNPLQGILNR